MKNLAEHIKSFEQLNVVVIGDVMLDTYIWGDSTRLSPEAPVPVITKSKTTQCLGGAGNVALNIATLGANCKLIGIVGYDSNAIIVDQLLDDQNISKGLIKANRPTTNKTRILARNQQIVRLDDEDNSLISDEDSNKIFSQLKETPDVDIVILQDYDKGVFSESLISKINSYCKENEIFVAVDPKKRNFEFFKNVDLFKPNLKEIGEGLNIEMNNSTDLEDVVNQMEKILNNKISMLTLSEKGILIKKGSETSLEPAIAKSVADVSGAGDTVIAVAALALKSHIDLQKTAQLCNIAASIVCQKAGVVPIYSSELISSL